MPPLTCSSGCDGCVRLTEKIKESEQRISNLHRIQDHERDVDIIFGRTFAAATSAQSADTIPCQADEPAEGKSIAGSPGGLGQTNTGGGVTSTAEEERWFQQGAKPKAPFTSTPVPEGTWSTVGPGRGGGARNSCHRSPPPGLPSSNRFGALEDDFPPSTAPPTAPKTSSSGGPPPTRSQQPEQQPDTGNHPRRAKPRTTAGTRRGVLHYTPNPRNKPSAPSKHRCSPADAESPNIQPVSDKEDSSAQQEPAHHSPNTLIIGDSIVRYVRIRGAVTLSFSGATVKDISEQISDCIKRHPSYRIGQSYMISKHSHEQSERGEGVEVVQNEPYEDPEHGSGQFTEKRIYLNNKSPSWARAVVPKIFYVTEKAWNYYPYTITEYTCSFLPKFSIHIESKYEDNKGNNDNIFGSEPREEETEVCFVDIAYDEISERHYKETEDLRHFKSKKTDRGISQEGWIDTHDPIMCSYKSVTVKFEVWGSQTRVEQFVHKVIRDVSLLGHRQAFAWVDEWIDMTMEEVREYERATQEATNLKIGPFLPAISISETPSPTSARSGPNSAPSTPLSTEAPDFSSVPKDRPRKKSAPETLTSPDPGRRDSLFKSPSFFSWNSSPQPE